MPRRLVSARLVLGFCSFFSKSLTPKINMLSLYGIVPLTLGMACPVNCGRFIHIVAIGLPEVEDLRGI